MEEGGAAVPLSGASSRAAFYSLGNRWDPKCIIGRTLNALSFKKLITVDINITLVSGAQHSY